MKVWTLSYADNIVLLAKGEDKMKSMMGKLEKYIDGKGLTINAEKSRLLRFKKGRGRLKKIVWRWKGKVIEKVKSFKYLGYVV